MKKCFLKADKAPLDHLNPNTYFTNALEPSPVFYATLSLEACYSRQSIDQSRRSKNKLQPLTVNGSLLLFVSE